MQIKNKNNNWLKSIIFSLFLACLIRWAIFENYKIPTLSMLGTYLPGDTILVSKIHIGPRVPQTPLQVPLTHQYLWGTRIKSYSELIKLPYIRFFGISKIKRGDSIVFNTPIELDKPIDLRTYYIKRFIGLPGDILEIKNSDLYINAKKEIDPKYLFNKYYLSSNQMLTQGFFQENNIEDYYNLGEYNYVIYTTKKQARHLEQHNFINTIEKETFQKGMSMEQFFGYPQKNWNLDYFGPLKIPFKGMVIDLDDKDNSIYLSTIRNYEKNNSFEIRDSKIFIDGKKITNYTFKQNYYFALGDNRHNSKDSRFIGFIPEDHIVGKALLILYSYNSKSKKSFLRNIRWNRIFKKPE